MKNRTRQRIVRIISLIYILSDIGRLIDIFFFSVVVKFGPEIDDLGNSIEFRRSYSGMVMLMVISTCDFIFYFLTGLIGFKSQKQQKKGIALCYVSVILICRHMADLAYRLLIDHDYMIGVPAFIASLIFALILLVCGLQMRKEEKEKEKEEDVPLLVEENSVAGLNE